MTQKYEIKRTYEKKDDVVVLKQTTDPINLTPKDILTNLSRNRAEINQLNEKITQAETMIVNCRSTIPALKRTITELSKYEVWAKTSQEKKCKEIINSIKDKHLKKVESEYRNDDSLTKEQNIAQRFRMYREYILRDDKLVKEIVPDISRDMLVINCVVENPWK